MNKHVKMITVNMLPYSPDAPTVEQTEVLKYCEKYMERTNDFPTLVAISSGKIGNEQIIKPAAGTSNAHRKLCELWRRGRLGWRWRKGRQHQFMLRDDAARYHQQACEMYGQLPYGTDAPEEHS